MNLINTLRRKLILRLIVYEYGIFGYLELLETLIFGEASTAEAYLLTKTFTVSDFKVVSQALACYAIYTAGTSDLFGPGVRTKTALNQSTVRYGNINTSHLKTIVSALYPMAVPKYGRQPLNVRVYAGAEVRVGRDLFPYGILFIKDFNKAKLTTIEQIKAILGSETNKCNLITILNIDQSQSIYNQFFKVYLQTYGQATQIKNNFNIIGKNDDIIKMTNKDLALLTFTKRLCGLESNYLNILNAKLTLNTLLKKINGREQQEILLKALAPITAKLSQAHGKMYDEVFISGCVKSQISKEVFAQLMVVCGLKKGVLSILNKDSLIDLPKKLYIPECNLNGHLILGDLIVLLGLFQDDCTIYGKSSHEEINVVHFSKKFDTFDFINKAVVILLDGESLQREGWKNVLSYGNIKTSSIPSYQKNHGIYGVLQILDEFSMYGNSENHTTMFIEITPDLENGGEDCNIITKYHYEQDGISYIGWSYFKELIE